LEANGYNALSFFQGGEYIYPIETIRANIKSQWTVRDYVTFNQTNKADKPYLIHYLSNNDFKIAVTNLNNI
jgi:hypothetical protein